jgi:hypothetical protein
VEITHLFDRTYGYRSLRELAWHLADRFDLSPKAVQVERVQRYGPGRPLAFSTPRRQIGAIPATS